MIRCDKAGDHFHGGGLAGTIWTKKTQHFAAPNAKRNVVDGDRVSKSLGEFRNFDHAMDLL